MRNVKHSIYAYIRTYIHRYLHNTFMLKYIGTAPICDTSAWPSATSLQVKVFTTFMLGKGVESLHI